VNAEGRMQNAEVGSGGDLKEFASIGVIRVKALFPVLFVSFVSFCSIAPASVFIGVHPWLKRKQGFSRCLKLYQGI
jgi:hypothetical protein